MLNMVGNTGINLPNTGGEDHSFMKFVPIIVLILIIGLGYWWYTNRDDYQVFEPGEVTDFEVVYESRSENIEVPGGLPISLISEEGLSIAESHYLVDEDTGREQYQYTVLAEGNAGDLFENALSTLETEGFAVVESNLLAGNITAMKDSGLIDYQVVDVPDRGLRVMVVYIQQSVSVSNQ